MNNLGQRIKDLRKQKNLTQSDFSEELNTQYGLNTDRSMVSKWETGFQTPVIDTVKKIADFFGVSIDYLNGDGSAVSRGIPDGFMPLPKMSSKPRLGVISCGEPIDNPENFDGFDTVPDSVQCDFTLKCEGDSMIGARIMDGDIVFIRQQDMVDNGEIAAVLVDGTEKLLKRVYISEDTVSLVAENPKYPPLRFFREEMNRVSIIGKAVGFMSTL